MGRVKEGDELLLEIGSTAPFVVEMVDDAGFPLQLGGVDNAVFTIKASATDEDDDAVVSFVSPAVEVVDSAGHLDPDIDPSFLRMSPAADALEGVAPGLYIGQGAIRYGSPDMWRTLDEVRVRIRKPIAVLE